MRHSGLRQPGETWRHSNIKSVEVRNSREKIEKGGTAVESEKSNGSRKDI